MNALRAIDPKAHSSAKILLDHECRITGHCDAYHTVLTSAMHVIQNYTELNLGWLPWFWYLSFMPIKADPQVFSCHNEYNDSDHSVMPTQDATDDYDPGSGDIKFWRMLSSNKVGSMNGRFFPLLIIFNESCNHILSLCHAPRRRVDIHRELL